MRMQIATIPTPNLLAHMEVAFVAGLVDVPEGWTDALDEHVADLNVSISELGIPESVAPVRLRPLEEAVPAGVVRRLSRSAVGEFVTARFPRTIPSDLSNAQVLFRLTDLPSSFDGGGVLAFAGSLGLEDASVLDSENVHELTADGDDTLRWTGRIGMEVRRHFGAPSIATNMGGQPLSSAFDLATWGFGHEPMALGTTVALTSVRRCQRYHDLFFSDQRSDEDELELAGLREMMVTDGFAALDRLPEMARALERFRTSEDYVSPFAPRSRAQQRALMLQYSEAWRGEDDLSQGEQFCEQAIVNNIGSL